jgi:allantoate deiminase
VEEAWEICSRRGIEVDVETNLNQPATVMDRSLIQRLSHAVEAAGYPLHMMMSGAGHDAMILAPVIPSVMLFLRSPAGLSHHPDETVLLEDVEAALEVGMRFIRDV